MAEKSVKFHSCKIAELPTELVKESIRTAIEIDPGNAAGTAMAMAARSYLGDIDGLAAMAGLMEPAMIAGYTNYFWRPGTPIPVYFLDNPDSETRRLILYWANEWNRVGGNLPYLETRILGDAVVRVARDSGGGYWSYLGTQNRNVRSPNPTMNMAAFTSRTPESEYRRVVCHEFGHQRGYIHGQMRKSIQDRLNKEVVIRRMMREQGWSRQEVIDQVFTPVSDSELTADMPEEELITIMMYPFPRSDTIDGLGIPGGDRITLRDAAFDKKKYGTGVIEPPKPPPDRILVPTVVIEDSIGESREVDWWPVQVADQGTYLFATEPAMAMGIYTKDQSRLLAPSAYGPGLRRTELQVNLPAGEYSLGVKHHFARGTGPYRVSLVKV